MLSVAGLLLDSAIPSPLLPFYKREVYQYLGRAYHENGDKSMAYLPVSF